MQTLSSELQGLLELKAAATQRRAQLEATPTDEALGSMVKVWLLACVTFAPSPEVGRFSHFRAIGSHAADSSTNGAAERVRKGKCCGRFRSRAGKFKPRHDANCPEILSVRFHTDIMIWLPVITLIQGSAGGGQGDPRQSSSGRIKGRQKTKESLQRSSFGAGERHGDDEGSSHRRHRNR